MKYKVLVNGKSSALIMDFIQHSGGYFKTISTTDYWPDIIGHFEMFGPDAYVCFVDFEFEKTLSQIGKLRNDPSYNGAAIIIVGDSKTCDMIEEVSRYAANLIIRRPISQDNLTLMITRYFEDMEEANKRAKAAEASSRTAEAPGINARASDMTTRASSQALKAEIEAKVAARIGASGMPAANTAAAYSPAASSPTAAAPAQAAGEKKHILVVDDDRTILKMLKTALEDKYDVTTMANGLIVEKFLETKKVDLIILDYEMPVETGADVFRKLKKKPATSHIPVCFLTGVTERDKIMEIMALKPHGYLIKPMDMDMLLATISNLTK